MNVALWVMQGFLAAIFLFAGGMKLSQSNASLAVRPGMGYITELSRSQVQLIAAAEVLGGLGLVLPWWLGILPILTPIAAGCLAILMLGAVSTHLGRKEFPSMTAGLAFGTLFVAAGRLWYP